MVLVSAAAIERRLRDHSPLADLRTWKAKSKVAGSRQFLEADPESFQNIPGRTNLECGVGGLSGFPLFLASNVASPGSPGSPVPALGILEISREVQEVAEVAGMSWNLP